MAFQNHEQILWPSFSCFSSLYGIYASSVKNINRFSNVETCEIAAGLLLHQHPKAKYGCIWAENYH
jgi:hypothetical protein